MVGLDLETLMNIAISGLGAIEDIAISGDASLDSDAKFEISDLGSLAPALGLPLPLMAISSISDSSWASTSSSSIP